jgi:transposase
MPLVSILHRLFWIDLQSLSSVSRHWMLTKGIVILHDNAWPHTNAFIKLFDWEIFDHPPYSPDLAPSNYQLFTTVKVWLATQRFHINE